jgi:hypothetical protein
VTAVAILAHQGGWDEILMVLGPIALMAGLLRLAKKRVDARQEAESGGGKSGDATKSSAGKPAAAPPATKPAGTKRGR